jgi:hypothetical protein
MVIGAVLVLLSAASAGARWASKSGLLVRVGLISVISALVVLGLLVYVQWVAAGRGSAEPTPPRHHRRLSLTSGKLRRPASSVAVPDTPPSQIPDAFPAHTVAAEAPSPVTSAEPMAQRKDFEHHRYRPLSSHHGAYSLEQAGTNRLFILAGSALGAKHDQAGTPREDAFLAEPTAPSRVVAAVADGVS